MPKNSTRSKVLTLRDLALDRIGELAAELRKSDPSLSREQAVNAVMKTAAGKEAYRFYNAPGGHLPWLDAVEGIVKAELSKAAKPSRKVSPPPTTSPADAIYGHIREQAIAAAPKGMSEAGAVATFLQTSPGQKLWAKWNAARRLQDE
ncbi:MAG: hypothetical protein ACYDB4_19395 [Candidatus Dormibacteraceae bacterium]